MKARQFLRVRLPLPVQIKVVDRDQEFKSTRIEDISWGGVFVVMDPPAELGARVVLQFALSGESVALELWGKVVRRVKAREECPAGMGIQFDPLDDDTRSLIQRLVDDEIVALLKKSSS
jgi:uncharacterized protein (TIGR02266 family)